jgi:Flp pilus assembly protein CpaB
MATRKGTVLVAAACAVVAAGILIFAFSQYRKSIDNGNRPETVFVASSLIQKGTSGNAIASQQLFKPATVVAKQVSAGAIADATMLTGKVAATNIYPGQQLTVSDFVPAVGIASTLAPDERAVSVPIEAAPGLVGNLAAGDHVDMYVGFAGNLAGRATALLRLLTPNVLVLQAPAGGGGGFGANGAQGGNITLAVNTTLAPEVMFASDNGKLWLSLRPGNASNPNPQEVVTLNSILLGSTPIGSSGTK